MDPLSQIMADFEAAFGPPVDQADYNERLRQAQGQVGGQQDAQYHLSGQANADAQPGASAASVSGTRTQAGLDAAMAKPREQWTSEDYFQAGQRMDASKVLWDEQGRPYWQNFEATGGEKTYISPSDVQAYPQIANDPRLKEWASSAYQSPDTGGFWRNDKTWDHNEGKYEQGLDWSNIVPLGMGGAVGGVALAGALAGAGAGGGAASAAGAGVPAIGGKVATGVGNQMVDAGSGIGGGFDWGSVIDSIPGGVGGLINTGANLVGGAMGSDAANDAARMQSESADKAIALQGDIYNQTRSDLQPFRDAGQVGLSALQSQQPFQAPQGLSMADLQKGYQAPAGLSVQELAAQRYQAPTGLSTQELAAQRYQAPTGLSVQELAGQQFKAPTAAEAQATPGFQFSLDNAMKALERSAAAKGTLLSSSTLGRMQEQATGLSEQNYGNVYNRAYQNFSDTQSRNTGLANTDYGRFSDQQNRNMSLAGQDYSQYADQQNRNMGLASADYGMWGDQRANNLSLYDRAYGDYRDTQGMNMGLAGLGQAAAAGQAAAGSNYASGAGDLMTQQGNAAAAGRVGSSNAWTGALGSIAENLTLQDMLKRGY